MTDFDLSIDFKESPQQSLETQMYWKLARDISPDLIFASPVPTTKEELKIAVKEIVGIDIPDKAVCDGHQAPFDAFADAYFVDHPISVWLASRGFGGKSVMLAALSHLETIYQGASVNLLGGSGEQSQRVHSYIVGDDTNLPNTFWLHKNAPRSLLVSDPTRREIRLSNGGRLKVLMASQRSTRGAHPQKLRCDEVDEMDLDILDAALGQPMEARGIKEQTVLSSTHHHADGTMTEVLRRASSRGYPIFRWCWRESESLWLSMEQVKRKQATISKQMWDVEYEMQEPNPGARAIQPESVQTMFKRELGEFPGELAREYIFEPPIKGAKYAHGADWARKNDFTVIITFRIDVNPIRLVAFERTHKQAWPVMVTKLDNRLALYGGEASHDATGLGDVISGYLEHEVEPFELRGRPRAELLSNYVAAIEGGEFISPHIDFMQSEHLYASVEDVYGSGTKVHLPDSICAGALAYRAGTIQRGWARGMSG